MIHINSLIEHVEREIINHLKENRVNETILEASMYSIKAGGKKFRPLLLFKTLQALDIDTHLGIIPAASLEMIHTYSLIHDDLPAMDDDTLRRGQPTNHIVFGEATAILAGDNLLTESFNLLTKAQLSAVQIASLVKLYSYSAGQSGMIGGQMLDIEASDKPINRQQLEEIHRHKTGKLIIAAVKAATIIAVTEKEITDKLLEFSEKLGLLFQVTDDILDVTGTTEELGKQVGSDEKNNKTTYVSLFGLEGARDIEKNLILDINDILESLKEDVKVEELKQVLELIVNRTK